MTISYVGSSSSGAIDPTSGNWTLSGISFAAGDVAFFWWWTSVSSKAVTAPGTIDQKTNTAVSSIGRLFVGMRVLQSGDSTFAWTASSVSLAGTSWGVDVFRGLGFPASNVSGSSATQYTNDNTPQAPAVVPTYGNSLIYAVVTGNLATISATDPSGEYTRAVLRTSGGLPATFVANFYKIASNASGSSFSPGPFSIGASSIVDGLLFTIASGATVDLDFPHGTFNLTLSDVSFEVGRLRMTGGGGGYPHPPLMRPYIPGQERKYREIVEAERSARMKDDEIAIILGLIGDYESDAI